MKRKVITLCLLAALLLTGGGSMVLGHTDSSQSERRKLAKWPKLTWTALLSGNYMDNAEKAAADQFPLRDIFRGAKALYLRYVMGTLDNNGIYVHDGSAGKLDYPLSADSVKNTVDKIQNIVDTHLTGTDVKCYYSVVPDKNYYLASALGYPAMDYTAMENILSAGLNMTYVDLFDLLEAEDYYRTDPHWRQECLAPVVEALTRAMGVSTPQNFSGTQAGDFAGAYVGQSALPLKPDRLVYLQSQALSACTAYDPVTGQQIPIYDLEKMGSRDPYELFLCGASPIQVIENPAAQTDRELVLFRDSFGSSLAPLLAPAYSKVTLIDLRYMDSRLISQYVTFDHQDVLFLYSTLILNSSWSLR